MSNYTNQPLCPDSDQDKQQNNSIMNVHRVPVCHNNVYIVSDSGDLLAFYQCWDPAIKPEGFPSEVTRTPCAAKPVTLILSVALRAGDKDGLIVW